MVVSGSQHVPDVNNIMGGMENTTGIRMHNHRRKLRQRFDLVRKLGQGTYGKVQLGINKETGQEVAIKTIKKAKIETEADLIRIRREIQIMSSVQHPNIIHIYEVFENKEKMVLVMEYAAGGELYDYLSERKVLSETDARRIFRQVSSAVYYCHKHKICHRDLKLENILLDESKSAKIADFGLSNVFDERRLLTTFCGSPLYASPEIVRGTPYHGPEVDCWSLGVLLYTLVYGAMPFDGSNFKRLVKQISSGDYYEPAKPSSASSLIRHMLFVDPAKRATVQDICSHWWVNEGYGKTCLEIAEELANQTPVRLDLLLSLIPPSNDGDAGDSSMASAPAVAAAPAPTGKDAEGDSMNEYYSANSSVNAGKEQKADCGKSGKKKKDKSRDADKESAKRKRDQVSSKEDMMASKKQGVGESPPPPGVIELETVACVPETPAAKRVVVEDPKRQMTTRPEEPPDRQPTPARQIADVEIAARLEEAPQRSPPLAESLTRDVPMPDGSQLLKGDVPEAPLTPDSRILLLDTLVALDPPSPLEIHPAEPMVPKATRLLDAEVDGVESGDDQIAASDGEVTATTNTMEVDEVVASVGVTEAPPPTMCTSPSLAPSIPAPCAPPSPHTITPIPIPISALAVALPPQHEAQPPRPEAPLPQPEAPPPPAPTAKPPETPAPQPETPHAQPEPPPPQPEALLLQSEAPTPQTAPLTPAPPCTPTDLPTTRPTTPPTSALIVSNGGAAAENTVENLPQQRVLVDPAVGSAADTVAAAASAAVSVADSATDVQSKKAIDGVERSEGTREKRAAARSSSSATQTESRQSKILRQAQVFNSLTHSRTEPKSTMTLERPKKVTIYGFKVSDARRSFETKSDAKPMVVPALKVSDAKRAFETAAAASKSASNSGHGTLPRRTLINTPASSSVVVASSSSAPAKERSASGASNYGQRSSYAAGDEADGACHPGEKVVVAGLGIKLGAIGKVTEIGMKVKTEETPAVNVAAAEAVCDPARVGKTEVVSMKTLPSKAEATLRNLAPAHAPAENRQVDVVIDSGGAAGPKLASMLVSGNPASTGAPLSPPLKAGAPAFKVAPVRILSPPPTAAKQEPVETATPVVVPEPNAAAPVVTFKPIKIVERMTSPPALARFTPSAERVASPPPPSKSAPPSERVATPPHFKSPFERVASPPPSKFAPPFERVASPPPLKTAQPFERMVTTIRPSVERTASPQPIKSGATSVERLASPPPSKSAAITIDRIAPPPSAKLPPFVERMVSPPPTKLPLFAERMVSPPPTKVSQPVERMTSPPPPQTTTKVAPSAPRVTSPPPFLFKSPPHSRVTSPAPRYVTSPTESKAPPQAAGSESAHFTVILPACGDETRAAPQGSKPVTCSTDADKRHSASKNGSENVAQKTEIHFPVATATLPAAARERIIPIQVEGREGSPQQSITETLGSPTTLKPSISRQESLGTPAPDKGGRLREPIRKSPREFIIPISVEGGGFVVPKEDQGRQQNVRNTPINRSKMDHLDRTKRYGGLFHDMTQSDEANGNVLSSPLQRLSSFGKGYADPRQEEPVRKEARRNGSASSCDDDDDDDDDTFQILTAENLFSTLLSRVRQLTRRGNRDANDPFGAFRTPRFASPAPSSTGGQRSGETPLRQGSQECDNIAEQQRDVVTSPICTSPTDSTLVSNSNRSSVASDSPALFNPAAKGFWPTVQSRAPSVSSDNESRRHSSLELVKQNNNQEKQHNGNSLPWRRSMSRDPSESEKGAELSSTLPRVSDNRAPTTARVSVSLHVSAPATDGCRERPPADREFHPRYVTTRTSYIGPYSFGGVGANEASLCSSNSAASSGANNAAFTSSLTRRVLSQHQRETGNAECQRRNIEDDARSETSSASGGNRSSLSWALSRLSSVLGEGNTANNVAIGRKEYSRALSSRELGSAALDSRRYQRYSRANTADNIDAGADASGGQAAAAAAPSTYRTFTRTSTREYLSPESSRGASPCPQNLASAPVAPLVSPPVTAAAVVVALPLTTVLENGPLGIEGESSPRPLRAVEKMVVDVAVPGPSPAFNRSSSPSVAPTSTPLPATSTPVPPTSTPVAPTVAPKNPSIISAAVASPMSTGHSWSATVSGEDKSSAVKAAAAPQEVAEKKVGRRVSRFLRPDFFDPPKSEPVAAVENAATEAQMSKQRFLRSMEKRWDKMHPEDPPAPADPPPPIAARYPSLQQARFNLQPVSSNQQASQEARNLIPAERKPEQIRQQQHPISVEQKPDQAQPINCNDFKSAKLVQQQQLIHEQLDAEQQVDGSVENRSAVAKLIPAEATKAKNSPKLTVRRQFENLINLATAQLQRSKSPSKSNNTRSAGSTCQQEAVAAEAKQPENKVGKPNGASNGVTDTVCAPHIMTSPSVATSPGVVASPVDGAAPRRFFEPRVNGKEDEDVRFARVKRVEQTPEAADTLDDFSEVMTVDSYESSSVCSDLHDHDLMEDESVSERIFRKSFYTRFNEPKKKHRDKRSSPSNRIDSAPLPAKSTNNSNSSVTSPTGLLPPRLPSKRSSRDESAEALMVRQLLSREENPLERRFGSVRRDLEHADRNMEERSLLSRASASRESSVARSIKSDVSSSSPTNNDSSAGAARPYSRAFSSRFLTVDSAATAGNNSADGYSTSSLHRRTYYSSNSDPIGGSLSRRPNRFSIQESDVVNHATSSGASTSPRTPLRGNAPPSPTSRFSSIFESASSASSSRRPGQAPSPTPASRREATFYGLPTSRGDSITSRRDAGIPSSSSYFLRSTSSGMDYSAPTSNSMIGTTSTYATLRPSYLRNRR